MIRVFIGYDSAERVATSVLAHSIHMHASEPVTIAPVMTSQLRSVFDRPRNDLQSTEFSFSRFLTPWLVGYEGWAIFMDCDMIMRDDIARLMALRDERYAVQVVKHEHVPKEEKKFLGQVQTKYEKKNWSSVMLMNCAKCKALTPEFVNTATGLELHQFKWLANDDLIGELPGRWNHLVGYDAPDPDAALVHFTIGGPWFPEYAECEFAGEWRAAREQMNSATGRTDRVAQDRRVVYTSPTIAMRPSAAPVTPPDPRRQIATGITDALQRRDFVALCRFGAGAQQLGMAGETSAAFDGAVAIMLDMIRGGRVDDALSAETAIYAAFVRSYEIEDHYERSFSRWRDSLAALGRTHAKPVQRPAHAGGIGFVVPTGVVLGHTEVLFRLLEFRPPALPVRIYVTGGCNPDFLDRAARLGIPVEAFPKSNQSGGATSGKVRRLEWLREQMARDGTTTAVWVSGPVTALFAFAMRVAPVQIFWTLRYHAVRIPEIDGYLTYGSWQERERIFHGQAWTVCPVPLALDLRTRPAADVASLRAKFPEKVLLGTLAREGKISSREFLETVAGILRDNPQCGFLWTGQERHAGIAEFFASNGVASRCHFVGWVDTPLYAAVLDIFLETFPLGCGITGYQALAAGVPLVSVAQPNTVFGMQYWSEVMERAGSPERLTRELLDEYPVLAARDGAEYRELTSRLISDAAFREQWKQREARFFAEEISHIGRYAQRFFEAIGAIAARKLQ